MLTVLTAVAIAALLFPVIVVTLNHLRRRAAPGERGLVHAFAGVLLWCCANAVLGVLGLVLGRWLGGPPWWYWAVAALAQPLIVWACIVAVRASPR
jgi:hypothetical protein